MNTIFLVFTNFVHHYVWVSTQTLNAKLTVRYLTELDFCLASSLHPDSRAIDVAYLASEDLWFSTYALKVDSNKFAIENIRILNYHAVISFWNNVKCTLSEIWKTTVRNLHIWIYAYCATTVISLITNKVASDKVYTCLWKSDDRCKFLIELIRNWFQTQYTFS